MSVAPHSLAGMPDPHEHQAVRRATRDHRGHHPWRFFATLTDWRLEWTRDLPAGRLGLTLHSERRVLLAEGMDQAERRCTIAHETGHILRGPVSGCHRLREEALVDRQAARLLMPSARKIGHALAWARADYEAAADELWVDEQLLNVRLSTLAPRDRLALHEQLATILVDAPA